MPNVTTKVLNIRDFGTDCIKGTVSLLHGIEDEFYNSFFKATCDILVSLHDANLISLFFMYMLISDLL